MAVRLAKKSAKPAYTLTMKLMPGLFTTEEMALSRSQGLLAIKGDLRPALDKDKVLVLKGIDIVLSEIGDYSNSKFIILSSIL